MDGIIRVSAIAMAVLMLVTGSIILTDDSDAFTDSSVEWSIIVNEECSIELSSRFSQGDSKISFGQESYYGAWPAGLEIVKENGIYWLKGTPTVVGKYEFVIAYCGGFLNTITERLYVTMYVTEHPIVYCTVTYDAGIGLVNGSATWSEEVLENSYASLPYASYSSGAYTFKGWGISATSSEPVSSYVVTQDVTLYAVWERNSVQISDATATVTSGQTSVLPIRTVPSDASLRVSSYGGLHGDSVRVSDEGIVLDMTGVEPGTYYVTVAASYTGYITGESVITIKVPITIVKPIEYVLSQGDSFSYTPVTNPSNADIELISVTLDGNVMGDFGGLSVSGRSVVGSFDSIGTYAITYTASLEGYVDVTNTVYVKVNERPASAPAPVMGTITATPRANEPRTYDFVISGYANASNIIWSYEGRVFATSSPTALFEFPSSGSYTVRCTLAGFDGSFVSEDVSVICLDNYHREAAWAGIPYAYIIESDDEVSIEDGAPFSVTTSTVGGKTYRMISGTPNDTFVGSSFGINLGDDSWSVQVYGCETSAPVVDFDLVLSEDGYTVVAVFKGQNASFYSYDFDGDGIPEQGNAYTYQKEGRYTVVCKAVNNVSETSKSDMVSINVVPHEDTDILELTDFQMVVGERLDVILQLMQGDVVTVSGPASSFVNVLDGILRAEPAEKGVFDLTVSVHHDNGTTSSKTIKVTVRGTDVQDLEEEKHDYMVVMAVFFVISVSAIALFILRDIRPAESGFSQRPSMLDRILRRRLYR